MPREKRLYFSYLLRLWQIKSGGQLIWRISLESTKAGKRQGFADLAALCAYLEQEMNGLALDEAHSSTIDKDQPGLRPP